MHDFPMDLITGNATLTGGEDPPCPETIYHNWSGEYCYADEIPMTDGRKTQVYGLYSVQGDVALGTVKWYAPWRRYCFYPADDTLYDAKCLQEISSFIQALMALRKAKK